MRNCVALDVAMIDQYDALLPKLERHIGACAKEHDRKAFTLLRSMHQVASSTEANSRTLHRRAPMIL